MLSLQTRAERRQIGKDLRKRTPRSAHGALLGDLNRSATAIIEAQNATRMPALLALRRELMSADPFAFFRGAAAVMAHDLASQPMAGAPVQACGDCHLMNFGVFASPENNILFDINDFDETLSGVDFTVDVKRLATSVALAAGEQASRSSRRSLAADCVRAYREHMQDLSQLSPSEVWHSRIDIDMEIEHFKKESARKKIRAILDKARRGGLDRDDNFPSLASENHDHIADNPPRIFHYDHDSDAAKALDVPTAFKAFGESLPIERRALFDRYALKDYVFKAVGVGSVGTYCYVGLMLSGDGEPMFIQGKEANPSVLEVLSSNLRYSGPQGQRVVEGQRIMQAASDIFLGWAQDAFSGRYYYFRTLKNRRLSQISILGETEELRDYGALCGRTLARAHARSGDAPTIAGYMGKSDAFDDAIADFAMLYADQTVADFKAWVTSPQ